MPKYTVIGFYPDTSERVTFHVEADNPEDAEVVAAINVLYKDNEDEFITQRLSVVGVAEGYIQMVGDEEYVQEFQKEDDWSKKQQDEVMH